MKLFLPFLTFFSLLSTTNSLSNSFLYKNKKASSMTVPYKVIDTLPGAIEPLGFWDPLNITSKCDNDQILYLREAEQHHGRVAMLSMVILPTLDLLDSKNIAIDEYSLHSSMLVARESFVVFLFYEFSRIANLYETPSKQTFRLKQNVYPGNTLNRNISDIDNTMINKELSNGRLAMIGAFMYILSELITNSKVI